MVSLKKTLTSISKSIRSAVKKSAKVTAHRVKVLLVPSYYSSTARGTTIPRILITRPDERSNDDPILPYQNPSFLYVPNPNFLLSPRDENVDDDVAEEHTIPNIIITPLTPTIPSSPQDANIQSEQHSNEHSDITSSTTPELKSPAQSSPDPTVIRTESSYAEQLSQTKDDLQAAITELDSLESKVESLQENRSRMLGIIEGSATIIAKEEIMRKDLMCELRAQEESQAVLVSRNQKLEAKLAKLKQQSLDRSKETLSPKGKSVHFELGRDENLVVSVREIDDPNAYSDEGADKELNEENDEFHTAIWKDLQESVNAEANDNILIKFIDGEISITETEISATTSTAPNITDPKSSNSKGKISNHETNDATELTKRLEATEKKLEAAQQLNEKISESNSDLSQEIAELHSELHKLETIKDRSLTTLAAYSIRESLDPTELLIKHALHQIHDLEEEKTEYQDWCKEQLDTIDKLKGEYQQLYDDNEELRKMKARVTVECDEKDIEILELKERLIKTRIEKRVALKEVESKGLLSPAEGKSALESANKELRTLRVEVMEARRERDESDEMVREQALMIGALEKGLSNSSVNNGKRRAHSDFTVFKDDDFDTHYNGTKTQRSLRPLPIPPIPTPTFNTKTNALSPNIHTHNVLSTTPKNLKRRENKRHGSNSEDYFLKLGEEGRGDLGVIVEEE
ncbi:MAG: hypothetical protein M1834_007580 [Cirrosporium novae-zelandiae]|nr:MAG: hypothetical protein M1834_007580 [Cirrosporium novae-zelandiae]